MPAALPDSAPPRASPSCSRAEDAEFERRTPRSRELFERARGSLLGGVPMSWMTRWAGALPGLPRPRRGRRGRRRRRQRLRRLLPRRHRRDGRPRAGAGARGGRARYARRGARRCCRPRTRPGSAEELRRRFGLAALAVHADRDRRQPLRDPGRPAAHRPAARSSSSTTATTAPSTRRFAVARADGERRRRARATSARRSTPAETTRVVEFNDLDGAGARARPRRRRLRARRAGADQHRHRPARRRASTPALRELTARGRHAAGHRRDAHDQRRAGRLHAALGPGARHRHARQGDRRRRPDRRLRARPRSWRERVLGAGRRRPRGHRRGRRHPGRQRALARGRPRDALGRC